MFLGALWYLVFLLSKTPQINMQTQNIHTLYVKEYVGCSALNKVQYYLQCIFYGKKNTLQFCSQGNTSSLYKSGNKKLI